MKVLLVNKFHWNKGGSEKYYFELGKMLKEHGHEVAYFSMKDEKNITVDGCKEYFVEPIDLNNGSKLKAFDVIYSKANKLKMEEAIEDFKPDVVHLNNFQRQLSASIIKPIVKRNIPIVFTAHDVQAICPAISMLDNDGNVCELCKCGHYKNCFKKKCNKGSTLKSFLGAVEGRYYRKHKIYSNKINAIVTPSKFYKDKFIEDGIDGEKIYAIHNSIDVEQYNVKTEDEGYALYLGRLSKEKGILNLIEAFSKIDEGKLYIAGDGPEKEKINKFITDKNLADRIQMLGFLNKEQVIDTISKCKFLVVPSIWYENCPYSVLETLSIGKPIIGADIGGIPELVIDNETGLLYKYNDVDDLSDKMKKLFSDKKLTEKFGNNAKEFAKKEFDKENYYNNLVKIYNKVIEENK